MKCAKLTEPENKVFYLSTHHAVQATVYMIPHSANQCAICRDLLQ